MILKNKISDDEPPSYCSSYPKGSRGERDIVKCPESILECLAGPFNKLPIFISKYWKLTETNILECLVGPFKINYQALAMTCLMPLTQLHPYTCVSCMVNRNQNFHTYL